ncbi:MAG: cation:proton antiporter, partial [Bacteroidota bacterium]
MEIGPNVQIIIISAIVILSFLFNSFSERTNIPAVLLLIFAGIGLKFGADQLGLSVPDLNGILSVMGTIGLIMIVLEAALELELTRDKLPTIWKSLLGAFVGLLASTFAAAAIIHYFVEGIDWMTSLLYATPLSILSSAIIIPSVGSLVQDKKEFHIYESTFSDILGIMVFYFLTGQLENAGEHSGGGLGEFFINLGITIGISLVASYAIILIFQNIK